MGPTKELISQMGLNQDARTTNISTPKGKYVTSVPNVYAAGDCRRGQSLIVWGINEGRMCAREVDENLMGSTYLPVTGGIQHRSAVSPALA